MNSEKHAIPPGERSPASNGFGAWLWRRPRRWFLLGIPIGGVLALLVGVGGTGGFLASMEYASTETFCTSCHDMHAAQQELAQSVHYRNPLGIRASCTNCHLPPRFIPGLIRHMEASIEVYYELRGELDTPAKYEAHRAELAQKVWTELKANDSAECRSCHTIAAMAASKDPAKAPAAGAISPDTMHQSLAPGMTCIDCHKGIAHTLPSTS